LTARITGEDYIKKIFQLPYSLAPVSFEQLNEFLQVTYDEAELSTDQRTELDTIVRPHLRFVVRDSSVNPREMKRYINSYILLTRINPGLDKNAVLTLQTIAFRDDWQEVRDAILEYGGAFIDAVKRRVLERQTSALQDLDPDLARIPDGFIDYMTRQVPGHTLLVGGEIDQYIYTGKAVRSVRNPQLLDAIRKIADVRRALREDTLDVPAMVQKKVSVANGAVTSLTPGLQQELLAQEFDELKTALSRLSAPTEPEDVATIRTSVEALTQTIRNRLLAVYRAGDVAGPPTAPTASSSAAS
jgi:KAP family P-loop domain